MRRQPYTISVDVQATEDAWEVFVNDRYTGAIHRHIGPEEEEFLPFYEGSFLAPCESVDVGVEVILREARGTVIALGEVEGEYRVYP